MNRDTIAGRSSLPGSGHLPTVWSISTNTRSWIRRKTIDKNAAIDRIPVILQWGVKSIRPPFTPPSSHRLLK